MKGMRRAGCLGSCKGGLEITAREKFLNSALSGFPVPVNCVKQANSLTVQHVYILPLKMSFIRRCYATLTVTTRIYHKVARLDKILNALALKSRLERLDEPSQQAQRPRFVKVNATLSQCHTTTHCFAMNLRF